jgi:uncharacterized protein
MLYPREVQNLIEQKFGRGKAIIVIGPRQVGKTTLIRNILKGKPHLFLNCDDPAVRQKLENINTEGLRQLIGRETIVFIDEAQHIAGVGLTLKLITDQFSEIQLIVSGSSSFELGNLSNEPLTGRKWEYTLFPISWQEFENHHGYLFAEQSLETRLIYGLYPDVLNYPGEEQEVLQQLTSSYLYKDILALANIRKPEILDKLILALALQLGGEVSANELAATVGIDKNTVMKYISILEKSFIIFRLGSFSRNLRNEIRKNVKIYFYDNGIRNAIIGNFNPLALRNDTGALWENFLISERMKRNYYCKRYARSYFWRTTQQQEIDYVEEYDGKLFAYEFKWSPAQKVRFPQSFSNAYQPELQVIHRENFRSFLMENV